MRTAIRAVSSLSSSGRLTSPATASAGPETVRQIAASPAPSPSRATAARVTGGPAAASALTPTTANSTASSGTSTGQKIPRTACTTSLRSRTIRFRATMA